MATVYIAPTAQGSADGTSAANAYAYSSLSSAETDAGAGGIIYFLDGTYNLGTETWDAGGFADMTFKSLNNHGAYLIGSSYIKIGSSTTNTFKAEGFASANLTWMVNHSSNNTVTTLSNIKHVDTTSSTKSGLGAFYGYPSGYAHLITNSSFILDYSGSSFLFGNNFGATTVNACSFFIKCSSVGSNGITSGTTPPTIKNTIFASDNASAIAASVIDTTDCTNCCIHQMNSTSHTSGGTNNVFSDPLYVDSSSDLRLRPSSPCINAGTAS